jgi:hypothetical protein
MMKEFEDLVASDCGKEHRCHVTWRGRVRRDQKTRRKVDLIRKQTKVRG